MNKALLLPFFLSFFLLSIQGCQKEPVAPSYRYLFLGHPYDWIHTDRVDPRLPFLHRDSFSGIWLGGDVCGRTTQSRATLSYLDSLFQLSNPSTHWAIGNHDILEGDESLIPPITQRPTFYASYQQGICLLVLNTNLLWHNEWAPPQEDCDRKQAQLALIQQVCDTIQEASHLVILHHHSLFNELKINEKGDTLREGNINGIPIRTGCDPLSNFTEEVYPQLVQVQEKGIQVVCVGGDYGMVAKRSSFTTSEGITLLGSGINNSLNMDFPPDYVTNFNPDSVLIFSHNPQQRSLDWSFHHLGQLVRQHQSPAGLDTLSDRVRNLVENW